MSKATQKQVTERKSKPRAAAAGLPKGWQRIPLGEIGKISMCKRVFNSQTSAEGDIPFYKIGTFGKKPDAFISNDLYKEYREKYSFPNVGDVLISASGTIGRRVIYDGKPAYFQDSNIVWIRHDEKKVLNKFLYYSYEMTRWMPTDGGTIARLYNDIIKKTELVLPPLREQEAIADTLSLWDEAIEIVERLIAAKQKRFGWLLDTMIKDLDCEHDALSNVSYSSSGGTPKTSVPEYHNGNIPWVSIDDMTSSGMRIYDTKRKITELGLKNSTARIYPPNTVLYAMYASLGECSIAGVALCSSQAILGIQPKEDLIDYEFLYYFLVSIKENIKKQGQQGTQPNLNSSMVRNIRIPVLPLSDQKRIVGILNTASQEIGILKQVVKRYRVQKHGLMQRLLTGEWRTITSSSQPK